MARSHRQESAADIRLAAVQHEVVAFLEREAERLSPPNDPAAADEENVFRLHRIVEARRHAEDGDWSGARAVLEEVYRAYHAQPVDERRDTGEEIERVGEWIDALQALE